ncbi:MAG: AhpC/TSA family protein [Candidatus Symbiothrix sp.]|jgi:peroxiredoxin|nr:AhpC/TSA family protein [Candidatus Symbiothrix sp.]
MKKIVVGLFGVCCVLSLTAQAQTYSIRGKIGTYNEPTEIMLQYMSIEGPVFQSSKLVDGQFFFTGEQSYPTEAHLLLFPNEEGAEVQAVAFILYAENLVIISQDILSNAHIEGSVINDPAKPLTESLTSVVRDTINLPEQPHKKELEAKIRGLKNTSLGAVAPDFELKDANGKPVRLSDFRGKYLLLDFWASWCGPCRRENPNLVSLYHKHKAQNFDILGVSLDEKTQPWQRAIQTDRLAWSQVIDGQSFDTSVALKYDVSVIPQNFLIDPQGVIIAKNLRGSALAEKISEL